MILNTIKGRRAVFPAQYNDETITKNEIETILEGANWAPTHRRTEPWRFKVIQGESQRRLSVFLSETYRNKTDKFSEFKFNKYRLNPLKAGCIIAICMQRDPMESIPEWEEIASTSMAVQNMWLIAHEIGIGAYWSSPAIISEMNDFMSMNKGERCLGFLYLGKYDGELPEGVRKTSILEKTIWV